ncbi:MAG TPA: PhzF family phenazine biosynthesis protein [Candidatus Bathyarchaeia archaeon]|nr:PhzF family phenazine biosynthesis protein [Candidatus Bathyarchaeia archaeon]
MPLAIYQVDAFTDKPFTGNPAGVCVLKEARDDRWMQNVACEMNLSETAFLRERADGFNLRWFTPTVEVDLCGHATLASSHILWQEAYLKPEEKANFHTLSGLLTARKESGWIELDFPMEPVEKVSSPPGLIEALGVTASYVGKSRLDYLVEIESETDLRKLSPDLKLLESVPSRGVIVTCRSESSGFDFVSRFFAPRVGIDEDPVTGSAHCALGPYWRTRLKKNEFLAYQASQRGGVVRVHVGDKRVLLSGQAVTVLRAELDD